MRDELKPYPAYKDSGVEWLGKVPEHWEILPLKRIARFKSGAGFPVNEQGNEDAEFPFIKVSDMTRPGNDPWIETSASAVSRETAVRLGAFVFPRGTIIFPKVGGALLTNKRRMLRRPGCIDNNLMSCVVRGADAQFSFNILQQLDFGQIAKPGPIPALAESDVREIRVTLPPIHEQCSIVRFVSHANRRIRRYIRAKQKLIKLLEEQKQAIIHRAVTRGLDPDVRLKPSGVESLGDVPISWRVERFKRRIGFQEGPGIMAADFRDRGVPLLRISCLRGDVATLAGCNYLAPDMVRRRWSHFAVRAGDYLLSASASTGTVVVATEVVAGAIPYTGILRLWPLCEHTFMPFVCLFISSRSFQDQIDVAKSGVAIEHFGPSHLKRMFICLPSRDEQEAIVEAIAEETAPLGATIDSFRREISLLHEYRTRLIGDVVTGKLDVREAAARLPDDAVELEPLEEADSITASAGDAADDLDAALEEVEV